MLSLDTSKKRHLTYHGLDPTGNKKRQNRNNCNIFLSNPLLWRFLDVTSQ
jgi:hypothetical protein